ncbi:MAG: metallophosphoesterase [Oscillospiraceae bacterium]|nr:metallophosphoesterase [Oscillospiraceae bacterium]
MQTENNTSNATKIIVFSDSHRDTRRMSYVIEKTSPDAVIHLGDCIDDARKIKARFPNITHHMLKGNCDYISYGDDELFISLGELKLFLTHGHGYYVKEDLSRLTLRASELEANLVLFGHTHKACIVEKNGITFMNPGQMEHHFSRRKASYGVVTLSNSDFNCEIIYLAEDW